MDENRKPASQESIDSLLANMKGTIDCVYREIYADMGIVNALAHGVLDTIICNEERIHLERVLKVHANVCYAILALCVQTRASLKCSSSVEKQYNIRRCIVTAHEVYKYLYGFTGKKTQWLNIKRVLQQKNREECRDIDNAAGEYEEKYAQAADGTLRDVVKHFSDNPVEFFRNIDNVNERDTLDRVVALLAFLQPIHSLLGREIEDLLGSYYHIAMAQPMPRQVFSLVSESTNLKEDELQGTIEKYEGIVKSLMRRIDIAESIGSKFNLQIEASPHWKGITEDNVGLHILYLYLDLMIVFRAFMHSETFVEYRQNLAYLIVSSHEGFKKLYGFDDKTRNNSYWTRVVKSLSTKSKNCTIMTEISSIEANLKKLSVNKLLKDEDRVVAFTHIGSIKKQKQESAFAVFDYFSQPVNSTEINELSQLLYVMNDIVKLYSKVLKLEDEQIREENLARSNEYWERIRQMDKMAEEKITDPEILAKWKVASEKLWGVISKINDMFSN